MRYLFGFMCVCGLSVMPLVACDLFPDPCLDADCPQDDNECTVARCRNGSCTNEPVGNGTGCTFGGLSGVCVEGVCGENLCEGVYCDDEPCSTDNCDYVDGLCDYTPRLPNGAACVYDGMDGVCVDGICGENLCEHVICDDEDSCTEDTCDYVDGTCDFAPFVCDDYEECTEDTCDPADGCKWTPVEDGTFCVEGVCRAGACVLPTDACTNAADLAAVCDPGFADEAETCARDAISDPGATAPCLVENTGVSSDCASCYGPAVRCIVNSCSHVCGPTPDSQECDDCLVENGCHTLLASCTGDLASACPPGGTMFDVGTFGVQP